MKFFSTFLITILSAFLISGFIYSVYWVGKTVSYSVFYEDMVRKTIREVVNGNCIKITSTSEEK